MKRIFHTDIDQKGPDGKPSEEWKEIRRAKFTSSDAAPYMVEGKKFNWNIPDIKTKLDELSTSYKGKTKRDDLIGLLPLGFSDLDENMEYLKSTRDAIESILNKKLTEMMRCEEPEQKMPWWVIRGNEMEDIARHAFELDTGFEIEEVGFVSIAGQYIGDSPDGLFNDRKSGLEIKIPLDKTHMGYLRKQAKDAAFFPLEHKFQTAHHIAVAGLQECHFYSWSPNPLIPPFYKIMRADEFSDRLLNGLLEMSDLLRSAKGEYQGIYDGYRESLINK